MHALSEAIFLILLSKYEKSVVSGINGQNHMVLDFHGGVLITLLSMSGRWG
jgi:hypothetical protein